jgi:hypothetical protein
VVYGSVADNDKEIALLTRSVLELLVDLPPTLMFRPPTWSKIARFPSPAPEFVNGAAAQAIRRDGRAKSRLCSTCVRASTLNVLETERGLVLNKLVTEQVGGEKQRNKTRLSTVS